MAGFALDISGIKEVQNAIKNIDTKASEGLSKELAASSLNIQKAAKRAAPGTFGKLRQSIQVDTSDVLFKSVFSTVGYAPYVEFGTRGRVFKIKGGGQVASEYHAFAAQYKGKGTGDYYDFLQAILLWVKRKKLAQRTNAATGRRSTRKSDLLKTAEGVAWTILKKGVFAQPFMIPAYETEKPKLLKRIRNLFK
jgi:hypothetical protein